MKATESSNLLDQAVQQVFEPMSAFDLPRVRNILTVVYKDLGIGMPASWALTQYGSYAKLLPEYRHHSLEELWKVIHQKEEEAQKSLDQGSTS